MKRFRIEFGFDARHLQEGLDFRGECETSAVVEIIEGLDAEVIARDKQRWRAGAQIANREGEHSVQALDAVGAFLLVEVDDHLRIGARSEALSFTFKFAAELQYCQGGTAPVLIRIETKAGHGAGKPTAKLIEETADQLAFLVKNLHVKVK